MYDIYIRISRLGDRTADEATEVYEAQCRDWANRNGISIDQVEEDTDVSGSVADAERKPRFGIARSSLFGVALSPYLTAIRA